jgi:cis-zeatin O-glucosyltransferase
MATESTESVAFVAVPFPAQGHLNQLLHLSLLVASRGLSVHYAAPAAQVRQARSRVHGWDPKALSSIHFHDLDVPAYESPAPDPTAPSPFPNHLIPMWEAFSTAASAPLAVLLRSVSATHRRVVVVYDRINSFAAVEAARLAVAGVVRPSRAPPAPCSCSSLARGGNGKLGWGLGVLGGREQYSAG